MIGFLIVFVICIGILGFIKLKEGFERNDVYFVLIVSAIVAILGGVFLLFMAKVVTFCAGCGLGISLVLSA